MTEIESLVARSTKYLHSAELLLDNGDYESSVSRSYYAMFYCVQALLLTKGLTVSSHAGLNTVFSEQFVKTGLLPKQMSRELNRAFQKNGSWATMNLPLCYPRTKPGRFLKKRAGSPMPALTT
jgi:uncharacterized protein (UPF0332 family)